ncbi:MAG: hypothetical protein V7K26_16210 [Nostoc sp.]
MKEFDQQFQESCLAHLTKASYISLGKDYIEVCPRLLWLINFRNIYRQIIISLQPSLKTQKCLAMFFNV